MLLHLIDMWSNFLFVKRYGLICYFFTIKKKINVTFKTCELDLLFFKIKIFNFEIIKFNLLQILTNEV